MQLSERIMGTTFTKMSSLQQNILGEVPFHISIELIQFGPGSKLI